MSRRIDLSIIITLFLAQLMLTIAIITHYGFDGLYGQDPFAYYNFAGSLSSVLSSQESLPAFFWPLGYPSLLAFGFTITGKSALTAQIITLLLGASLPPLIYVLARQLEQKRLFGVISAIIMGICGQAIQSSLVIMADIPSLFWGTLSAVILLRYTHTLKTRWLVLSALVLAIASITRWLYLIFAIPWAITVLHTWRWRINSKVTALVMITVSLIFIPQFLYSTTTPYPSLNHAWVEGWDITNAFEHEFINIDGHFNYEMVNSRFYAQPFYDAYYLAPILTPLLIIGLVSLVFRKKLTHIIIIFGWLILPYLFLIGIPYQNIRFPLIIFPVVAISTGFGFQTVVNLTQSRRTLLICSSCILAIMLALGVSQSAQKNQMIIHTFITNQQRDKAIAYWLSEWIPVDSTLYTFGITLTVQHYNPSYDVYEIFYETPNTLTNNWVRNQDDYLLLNVWQIENQWDGREPQTVYHWFRNERELTQLARHGNYTLFRISG